MDNEGPPVLKIHDCLELPSGDELQLDANCLIQIASVFRAGIWRGNGASGFVIETFAVHGSPPKAETLIVKVSILNVREIKVACALNNLSGETPVFPHTYGWLVGETVPEDWLSFLKAKKHNHKLIRAPPPMFMFTFIQPVKSKWEDAMLLSENGYRVVLFFLLHGLFVVRRALGFNHGDIRGDNIMMEYHMQQQKETTLRYGQYEAEVKTRYVPRFIDYGRSTVNNEKVRANDLEYLRKMFEERLSEDANSETPVAQDELREFKTFVASSGWEKIEYVSSPEVIQTFLEHSYFDISEIQRRQVKRQAVESQLRCFSCCAPSPEHQINHQVAAPKYFCSKWCYEKMHAVCGFIH